MGVMFLSIESARMFIEKQRMGSVVDSVALYLASLNQYDASLHGNAILNSITRISEADSQAIFRQMRFVPDKSGSGKIHFEYSKGFKSWFDLDSKLLEKDSIDLATSTRSRLSIDGDMDVVFVVDYSNSMNYLWMSAGDRKIKRIDYLREALSKVISKLSAHAQQNGNKIRMAIVPYDEYVRHPSLTDGGKPCNIDSYNSDENSFSAQKTIEDFWTYSRTTCIPKRVANLPLTTIPLTQDEAALKSALKTGQPYGWTASNQGIFLAAQMLDRSGDTPTKLMILISDGMDTRYYWGIDSRRQFEELIKEHKVCKLIRDRINTPRTVFSMAVVGIDYNSNYNRNLRNCFGQENIYNAYQGDKIYDKIINVVDTSPAALR